MKAFERIQLLLIAAFIFAIPIAVAAMSAGKEFSWRDSIVHVGIVAGVLVALMAINFFLARIWFRFKSPGNQKRNGIR